LQSISMNTFLIRIKAVLLFAIIVYSLPLRAQNKSNITNGRWTAWSEKPAIAWEDAFVTGNGRHGAMITGTAGNERIICTHEELFLRAWDRHKIAMPNIANLLPEVRRLSDLGQFQAAAEMASTEARKQLTQMGAPQVWPVSPHPAFDLNVKLNTTRNNAAYRRQLNMETGEVVTSWNDDKGRVVESVFSSRIDNVNVLRIHHTTGTKLNLTLSLTETPGRSGSIYDIDVSKAFNSVKSGAEEPGWLTYHAQYANDPGSYEGLARVTTIGGQVNIVDNRIQIKDASEILVILRITPLEYGTTTQETIVRNELSALPADYENLLKPHAKQHGEMFRRVKLDLGCAAQWVSTPTEKMLADAKEKEITPLFLEQMHAMGRYLLISSSGKYPPPLQGIWGGGWKPQWIGGFVFDSNVNLAILSHFNRRPG
jgi:hypothetical protein